jgi:hypothetical protein
MVESHKNSGARGHSNYQTNQNPRCSRLTEHVCNPLKIVPESFRRRPKNGRAVEHANNINGIGGEVKFL